MPRYIRATQKIVLEQITPSLQRVPNTTLKPQTRVYFVKNNASNRPTGNFLTRNKSVFEFLRPDFKTRSATSLIGTPCFPFSLIFPSHN